MYFSIIMERNVRHIIAIFEDVSHDIIKSIFYCKMNFFIYAHPN